MATMLALAAFDWLRESKHRKSLQVAFHAGTDNRANEALTLKRATTKWPLMAPEHADVVHVVQKLVLA